MNEHVNIDEQIVILAQFPTNMQILNKTELTIKKYFDDKTEDLSIQTELLTALNQLNCFFLMLTTYIKFFFLSLLSSKRNR